MTPDDQPATKHDLTTAIAALEQRLTQALDRAIEAMVGNVSDLRQEMNRRFDHIEQRSDQRFDTIERRTERLELHMQTLILQTAGMSKSLTDAERLDTATAAALAGQQRAIDDLYSKVAEIQMLLKKRPAQ